MHQPWASLLVAGIKRTEGRSWSSPHRGRLWIAAASHPPTDAEIEAVEHQYRVLYRGRKLPPFPKIYPTAALLGCVDVVDCLTAEEIAAKEAKGEEIEGTDSDYGFVCCNPRLLAMPLSVRGDHKIWRMDPTLLVAAQQALLAAGAAPTDKFLPTSIDIHPSAPPISQVKQLSSRPDALSLQSTQIRQIMDGVVVIRSALSLATQQLIIDTCRNVAAGVGGFYTPQYTAAKEGELVINRRYAHLMCMGKHWNPINKAYETVRQNVDGAPIPPIPELLLDLSAAITSLVNQRFPSIPLCNADLLLVNFYEAEGKLNWHQDKSESPDSLHAGIPVISVSIGDAAEFAFSPTHPDELATARKKPQQVRLESGDVLVFGGPARMIYHSVIQIHPLSRPEGLHMVEPGRLNLTFRQW